MGFRSPFALPGGPRHRHAPSSAARLHSDEPGHPLRGPFLVSVIHHSPCLYREKLVPSHTRLPLTLFLLIRNQHFYFLNYYSPNLVSSSNAMLDSERILSIVIFLGEIFHRVKGSDYNRSNICSESNLNPR